MKNLDLETRKNAATPRGISVLCNFFADKAENSLLWDVEGNRYIDFAGGIAVLNTGHRHPKLIAAIKDQLHQFTHTAYQIIPYANYIELAEKINLIVPGPGPKKTAFFTTGAEAVENAIKIARYYTQRPAIIAFNHAFHGRTLLGMTLTAKVTPYKKGFGPLADNIFHVPFPNLQQNISVDDAKQQLETLFATTVDPEQVAAIIIEPVQGEGGFNICPKEFMVYLRDICNKYRILLIADEVQTGFGRTGKFFAMEHFGVHADLTTMAKSLAGGMPLSAVCGNANIMDAPAPGGLGGTYAGNPLAIAAALAVIDIIHEENLLERGNSLGQYLIEQLQSVRSLCPNISDIRGIGAMVAVEFRDPQTKLPDTAFVTKVQKFGRENGLILLNCGPDGNVIRFLFPLTISDDLFEEGVQILKKALTI